MKFNFPHKYLSKSVSEKTKKRKKAAGLCRHHGCRNQRRQDGTDCNTCRSRKWRMNNPKRYAFGELRKSANKRKIPFELTFEQFLEFDKQTGYVANKGNEHDALSVDRIDSSKGYSIDNIRALTWLDNVSQKLEKMTDPIEPIAQALCLNAGGDNWHAFKKQAGEVLFYVEILQEQIESGFVAEKENDGCPF